MTAPHTPERQDDLKQRYLQASAEQAGGPSDRVRIAALAHAQAVASSRTTPNPSASPSPRPAAMQAAPPAEAANRSRWNVPLVASLAIASISALLALQFDRSDSDDKQVVLGRPSATAPVAPAAPAAPAVSDQRGTRESSAALPAPSAAPTPQLSPQPAAKIAPAPTPTPAPAPTPTPTPTPKSTPESAPAGLASPTTIQAQPPTEAADVADRSAASRPADAQRKSTPTPDAENSAPAAARGESSVQGAAPAAAQKSRSAAVPNATSAAASAPFAASRSAPPPPSAVPQVPPPDAGALLREAARTGQLAALIQALQTVNAAQLNSTDSTGRTALMLATQGGHAEAVQRLLNAGADAALKDASGQTAEQTAKRLGFQSIENVLKSR